MTGLRELVSRAAGFPEYEGGTLSAPGPIWSWGTNTSSGADVSQESAFKLTTVFRAVELISGQAASLPLEVFNRDGAPVSSPFATNPAGMQVTPFEWVELVIIDLLTWGDYVALKRRDAGGGFVRLERIEPYRVLDIALDAAAVSTQNQRGLVYTIARRDGSQRRLTPAEVFHVRGFGTNGLRGKSRIAEHREALGLSVATERFGAKFFGNGARWQTVITTDKALTKDNAEALRDRWREKQSGPDSDYDIAVLDNGAQLERISIPPEDAQFILTRTFQVEEVARMFGLSPADLGETSKTSTYGTGIAENDRALARRTLRPLLERIEQRVTLEILAGGRTAAFNMRKLERGNPADVTRTNRMRVQAGAMTPNEARIDEGRQPLPGLDVTLLAANMTAIDADGDAMSLGKHDGTTPDATAPKADGADGRPPAQEAMTDD